MPADSDIDILLTADEIRRRVNKLAAEIRRDMPGPIHLVAALKGAFVFLADLARELGDPVSIDFLAVSSYGARTRSSGEVTLLKDLDLGINGRDVLIVEDIVDTGYTLTYLQSLLRARSPRTLRAVALLSKPSRRLVDVHVVYVGFEIGDRFVVGYGLDLSERYRNLPYIGAVLGTHAGSMSDNG
jgi:hypoxanthine phosphoribosyltransferase